MNKIYKKSKLDSLKEKASKRKNNIYYRHIPDNVDIAVANENAKLLEKEQYKTLVNN